MKIQTLFIALLLPSGLSAGASVVLDSFTEGSFSLSPSSTRGVQNLSSPVIFNRAENLRPLPFSNSPAPNISATLSPSFGQLDFSAEGRGVSLPPLGLTVTYGVDGSLNLADQTAFEFDFSKLGHSGDIIIGIGSSPVIDENTLRTVINSSGITTIPFSQIVMGPNATLSSVNFISITFEAGTDGLAFTLDEIRTVPEPTAALLTAATMGSLMMRRRR